MKSLNSYLRYASIRISIKGWLNMLEAAGRKFGIPASSITSIISRFIYSQTGARLRVIRIETMTGCNYQCPFCPTGRGVVPPARMSYEVFEGIIEQLKEFTGSIHLFFRNEPLLDKRLEEWARVAAERTKAKVVIQTNGSLLSNERMRQLTRHSTVIVNDYFGKGSEAFPATKGEHKVVVIRRSFKEKLSNRAGNVPDSQPRHLKAGCSRPFRELTVAADGSVVLCCQDWKLEERLGSVNETSLSDIWDGAILTKKRAELLMNVRTGLCSKCDYSGV